MSYRPSKLTEAELSKLTKAALVQRVLMHQNASESADKYFSTCDGYCGEVNTFDSLDEVRDHIENELSDSHSESDIKIFAGRELTFEVKREITFE